MLIATIDAIEALTGLNIDWDGNPVQIRNQGKVVESFIFASDTELQKRCFQLLYEYARKELSRLRVQQAVEDGQPSCTSCDEEDCIGCPTYMDYLREKETEVS